MFVPYFLFNLYLATENRDGEFYAVLNEDSPVEGVSVGKFLLLLFSIVIQDRLIIQGDWTFCFGLLIRNLIGPDGCINVATLLSIREICFFAKLRKGSMYWLRAWPRARALGTSVYDVLKDESWAEMTALLNAVEESIIQGVKFQFIADAGVNPNTKEDETISFVIDFCQVPEESALTEDEYLSLSTGEKIVEQLMYGSPAILLAVFMESTHTQGPAGNNLLARPMYRNQSWIQYEEGFSIADEGRTIHRRDWKRTLTSAFVDGSQETVYLIQFSGRPVAPASNRDQFIVPKGELVGLAHTFLPGDRAGFATKIMRDASDDSCVVVEVEGYSAEERANLRKELEISKAYAEFIVSEIKR
jgi:hypothetical protein